MLGQLPCELRLYVFKIVLCDATFGRGLVHVTRNGVMFHFGFTDDYLRNEFGDAISCLEARSVGQKTAAAVIEALCRSEFVFTVPAEYVPEFLSLCPLSHTVEPGRLIKRLRVFIDEEPNFAGDGSDGPRLRKADWVDLDDDWVRDIATRAGSRTRLMRQCSRCLLKMPQLQRIHFWITPAQGKASQAAIQRWEVRDLLPTIFRLWCRSVNTYVYLRTWETYKEPEDSCSWFLQGRVVVDESGLCETLVDLEHGIPFTHANWRIPTKEDRVEATAIRARQEHWSLPNYSGRPDSSRYHKVTNYDTVQELIKRLEG
jgi:hypothetical protein